MENNMLIIVRSSTTLEEILKKNVMALKTFTLHLNVFKGFTLRITIIDS